MTAPFQGIGDVSDQLSSLGERARQLSPVTFRARVRQDEKDREREVSPAPEEVVPDQPPRRLSRHFGSRSPKVF